MREEIETTRAEKLLAWVLAAFLLVGGIWAYVHLDRTEDGYFRPAQLSAADTEAVQRAQSARTQVVREQRDEAAARRELELRREAYRTALDAGRSEAGLERAYLRGDARLDSERRQVRAAQDELEAARGPATAAQARIETAQRANFEQLEDERRADERLTFGLRLAYVLATLGAVFALFASLRRRGSRYQVVGLAAIGFATAQAFVLAGDYLTDYIDITELGPLVLSLVGVALSLAALVALQKYVARRVPPRRVRKQECPFCGFPVGAGPHCEGCGRTVVGACAACEAPRRVGTPHCATCGV